MTGKLTLPQITGFPSCRRCQHCRESGLLKSPPAFLPARTTTGYLNRRKTAVIREKGPVYRTEKYSRQDCLVDITVGGWNADILECSVKRTGLRPASNPQSLVYLQLILAVVVDRLNRESGNRFKVNQKPTSPRNTQTANSFTQPIAFLTTFTNNPEATQNARIDDGRHRAIYQAQPVRPEDVWKGPATIEEVPAPVAGNRMN